MIRFAESNGKHRVEAVRSAAELVVLRGCVASDVCGALRAALADLPFERATVRQSATQAEDRHLHLPDLRNNLRARTLDRQALLGVEQLVERHLQHLGVSGFTVPLTAYRYESGSYFGQHRDGTWTFPDGSRSTHTLLLCLVAPGAGGATVFPSQGALAEEASVRLGVGDALVFPHGLLHRATAVEFGEKLLLRTNLVAPAVAAAKAP